MKAIQYLRKISEHLRNRDQKNHIKISFIISNYESSDSYAIISFKEKIIKLPQEYIYNAPDDEAEDLSEKDRQILEELLSICAKKGISPRNKTLRHVMDEILEIKDVIIGYVSNNSLQITHPSIDKPSPVSSPYIKKIVNQLGLSSVSYETTDENMDYTGEQTYYPHELVGDIPEFLYHGTSTKYLEKLLRIGFNEKNSILNSNFQKAVIHNNVAFFATEKSIAEYYAFTASSNTNCRPIIIKISSASIKNSIVPDWDIDNMSEQRMIELHGFDWEELGAENVRPPNKKVELSGKSTTYSKHFGKFGVNGPISPLAIKSILFKNSDEWMELSTNDTKKLIYELAQVGMDYIIHEAEYDIPEARHIDEFIEEFKAEDEDF